jgi:hypothetical protein
MKWLMAGVVVVTILYPIGVPMARADMIPSGPRVVENPTRPPNAYRQGVPAYSIAAGVVALTLTGSLVALRTIRKRNDKLPS